MDYEDNINKPHGACQHDKSWKKRACTYTMVEGEDVAYNEMERHAVEESSV